MRLEKNGGDCSSATANQLCGLSGLTHLILELLNRAGAKAEHLADLADADAGRQELPSFLELVRLRTGTAKALNVWPALVSYTPLRSISPRTRSRPLLTRSRIISRSNSANTPSIWNIARPAGVVRVYIKTDTGALDGLKHLDQVRHRPAQPI